MVMFQSKPHQHCNREHYTRTTVNNFQYESYGSYQTFKIIFQVLFSAAIFNVVPKLISIQNPYLNTQFGCLDHIDCPILKIFN